MIGKKDLLKLAGISVVACCAAFVCSLMLSYRFDLAAIDVSSAGEEARKLYDAQLSNSLIVSLVTGGCLVLTSIVMLLTYIRNYVDTHCRELGVMKALGHSDLSIAKHFWVFGLSVLIGSGLGWGASQIYMPEFYKAQEGSDKLYTVPLNFHIAVPLTVVVIPSLLFVMISVFFAARRLRKPVMNLLHEEANTRQRASRGGDVSGTFLSDLRRDTVRSRYSLIFFIWFSAFCFGSNVQMAFSMKKIASATFGVMILVIGLILSYMMLFLALSAVVKGSAKTVAMMRVFGYDDREVGRAVLNGFRPIAWIGFAIGTAYQFGLLKIMLTVVFKDLDNLPDYSFDIKALCIALPAFIISYELIMFFFSSRIRKLPVKSIMLDC